MIIVDTSVILAAFDATDAHHARARDMFVEGDGPYVVSPYVLAEVDYLVTSRLGSAAALRTLRALAAAPFAMVTSDQDLLADCLDVLERPSRAEYGLADASLVAISETLKAPIATFDRRHFPTATLPA